MDMFPSVSSILVASRRERPFSLPESRKSNVPSAASFEHDAIQFTYRRICSSDPSSVISSSDTTDSPSSAVRSISLTSFYDAYEVMLIQGNDNTNQKVLSKQR